MRCVVWSGGTFSSQRRSSCGTVRAELIQKARASSCALIPLARAGGCQGGGRWMRTACEFGSARGWPGAPGALVRYFGGCRTARANSYAMFSFRRLPRLATGSAGLTEPQEGVWAVKVLFGSRGRSPGVPRERPSALYGTRCGTRGPYKADQPSLCGTPPGPPTRRRTKLKRVELSPYSAANRNIFHEIII